MRYVLTRLAQMVAVVLAVTFLAFSAMNLLGDPLFNILGPIAIEPLDENGEVIVDQWTEVRNEAREEYHLNDNFFVRYGRWVGDMLTGDFGRSFKNDLQVSSILGDRLPITIFLMVYAQAIAVLVSIPWALYSAARAYRLGDKVSTVISFGLLGIPVFALVVVLFWLFAVQWRVFPTRYDGETFTAQLWSMFLPAVSLAVPLIATYQRLLRTDLISTLQEDFIAVARAKGMSGPHILFRHALRPSLFSMLTVFGIQTGALIGGSIVVEQYFGIPGIGSAVIEGIIRDDFPLVLAIVVVISVIFVVVNVLVDIAYTFLDPRVRLDG